MTTYFRTTLLRLATGLAFMACLWTTASAQPATIVAFGNSQTEGANLPPEDSYPARLQAILRRQGLDVQVINAGIGGDTTPHMLQRLDGDIPEGTRLVILQPGANDGQRRPAMMNPEALPPEQTAANVEAMVERLRQRGIKVLLWRFRRGYGPEIAHQPGVTFIGAPMQGLIGNPRYMQQDGFHLTPAGYAIVAQRVAPYVIRALHQR